MALLSKSAATLAEAQKKAMLETVKKGKSDEQKKVLDFFYDVYKKKGCGCFAKLIPTMTVSEYVALVQSKCDAIDTRAKAIAKIGVDESELNEIAPIALSSFVYDDDTLVKIEDRLAVSSQYAITWIFFGANQIYTYKYIFDTTSDDTYEFTNDFFYNDITCFSTSRFVKEKIDIVRTKGCLSSREDYVKNNYVVDKFEIIVPGTSYQFSMRYNESFDQSVQAAKAVLRAKKFNK